MSQARNITPIRRKSPLDISFTGLVFCMMMAILAVAAMNGQVNLLFGVFGLMIGVLMVSMLICLLVLSRLNIERTLPEYCVVGRPTTLVYQFKNRKRFWPSMSVTLSELDGTEAFEVQPSAYLLHAAAGRTANAPVDLLPKRRGKYQLGAYQVATSFPFGFVKHARERTQHDSVLVCPALGRVSRELLSLCRSHEQIDNPVKPRAGGQDEFYGVKEHRQGENPRWIYWRRSARAPGVLVSKEMTQAAPPRLLLAVDTYLPNPTLQAQAGVERTLAMAASLASDALDNGMAVGLCAWGGTEWTISSIQQGKRQRRDLLAILACLPPNSVADTSALLRQSDLLVKEATTAVLFTPSQMTLSLTDRLRGALVVVSATSQTARNWFAFDREVDFTRCIPMGCEWLETQQGARR